MRYIKLLFALFTVMMVISCNSSKRVTKRDVVDLPPVISLHKLIKNVDTATEQFDYLSIKKIDVEIDNGEKKQSFKASLKMQNDNFIQISINAPLGIEVLRVLLKQDSFSLINYHEKYFVKGDYKDFSSKYGIDIDYNLLQSIFTNRSIIADNSNINELKIDRNGYDYSYVIHNDLNRILKKKDKGENDIYYIYSINGESFKPIYTKMQDLEINSEFYVEYSSYENFNSYIFPSNVNIKIGYEGNKLNVDMDYSKIEFNIPAKISFKIPSKYEEKSF